MQNEYTPALLRANDRSGATHTIKTVFSPVTNGRTVLPPQEKRRLARRFLELQHTVRQIARSEGLRANAVECVIRERYWSIVSQAGAQFGGGMLAQAGRRS